MQSGDTIAAISSSVGPAARMIVRLSGPETRAIARSVASIEFSSTATVERAELLFRNLCVPAWVYLFNGPRSYTGEDSVEFHIPGNPLLARMLLDELIQRGARHAEPGEFTARAYFNGRIDLSEAEGVAATIAAQNAREMHAARQLLAGELARRLRPTLDSLADALALVELGLDFSEEGVTFLSQSELTARITSAGCDLEQLLAESARFETLCYEPRIVLVGRPNAGKSTLLNALCGHERAVVSPQAGTTRDAIWSHASLERGRVRIIDVAGLDETASVTDEISQRMQQTARRAIEQADVVVVVRDITDERPAPVIAVSPDLVVLTKLDLAGLTVPNSILDRAPMVAVSALSGQNMIALRKHLDILAFGQPSAGTALALNSRHVEAITAARDALHRALASVHANQGPEIIALELRSALDDLGRVLGSVTPDDVLGRIFAGFCIGK